MPMPNFIFSLDTRIEDLAKRLAKEALLPLFKKLHPLNGPGSGKFDLAVLNIAATNMMGGETGAYGGNVATMFKRYNEVFPEGDREKKRTYAETEKSNTSAVVEQQFDAYTEDDVDEDDDEDGFLTDDEEDTSVFLDDEDQQEIVCKICEIRLPLFAVGAHERFHKNMGSG